MEHVIKNKNSGEVIFCAEDESFKNVILLAIKNNVLLACADLSGANLEDADLRGADLRNADLRNSYLRGADMRHADMRHADLEDADLSGADMRHADMRHADLSGANLRGADLRNADLMGADLRNSYLRGADLRGANLSGTDLRVYKHDLWGILLRYQTEIPGLIKSIKEGKIDGSVYSGGCACLMGTIANIKHCGVDELTNDYNSPVEQWFTMIKPGDTPENSFAAQMALDWINEFVIINSNGVLKR